MRYLRYAAIFFAAAGVLMIIFAKQLAIVREGPQYSMSDLGFVVGGMMLVGLGILVLGVFVVLRLLQKRKNR